MSSRASDFSYRNATGSVGIRVQFYGQPVLRKDQKSVSKDAVGDSQLSRWVVSSIANFWLWFSSS